MSHQYDWAPTAVTLKAVTDCSDATYTLFPDGRIIFNDLLLKSDQKPTDAEGNIKAIAAQLTQSSRTGGGPPPIVPALLCLKDYGGPMGQWPAKLEVHVTQEEGYHDTVTPHPGEYVALPNNPVGFVKVDVVNASSATTEDEIYEALNAADTDRELLDVVRWLTPPAPPRCDPAGVIDAEIKQHVDRDALSKELVHRLLFSAILPTNADAGAPELLWIDADEGYFETNTKQPDKSTMRIWGFNVLTDGSQELAVIKGSQVVQTATVGALVAYGLGVGLGTSFAVNPGSLAPSTSATTTALPTSSTAPTPTAAAPPPPPSALPEVDAACIGPANGTNAVLKKINEHVLKVLGQRAQAKQQAKYTALMNYISVDGGFHYRAVVRETAALAGRPATSVPSPDSSSHTSPDDGTIAGAAPVIGSETFATYSPHRYASFALEEAWNVGNAAHSGYGYIPVSEGGPDQLYQVEEVTHVSDRATFSGLFVVYPFPILCRHYTCEAGELSGVGLGFGPTFLRGGTPEFLRQWNMRLMWEPFPQIIPDLLLSVGGSWRSIDVVTATDPVGSIVSVPKPATTPSLLTTPQWERSFSVGLSVDLAILTSAVSSVSTAVSGKTGGK